MKKIILGAAAIATATLPTAGSAEIHSLKYSAEIHLGNAGCVFFRLDGVTVADSTVASRPWFALDTTQYNFKSLYAILLSANLGRRPVSVSTQGGGAMTCGEAAVTQIKLD